MFVERICAVHKPSMYNLYFTARFKAGLVACTAFLQLASIAWAALSAFHNEFETSTQHCAIISSTSIEYSTFHFSFVVFAYVVSFCSLAVVYWLHREIRKGVGFADRATKKKQPQITVFLIMTGIDIFLVAMPSFVMISAKWNFFHPNDIAVSLTYSTTG
ncbi:Protein R02D5.6 d, partial [Aphelenchoides avenae]